MLSGLFFWVRVRVGLGLVEGGGAILGTANNFCYLTRRNRHKTLGINRVRVEPGDPKDWVLVNGPQLHQYWSDSNQSSTNRRQISRDTLIHACDID